MNSSRRTLPTRRRNQTWKVKIAGKSVFLTYSTYQDGSLAEVFLDVPKYGSAIQTWMQESAMMFSLALQHGTPLAVLINLFANSKSDPHGVVVGHPDIVSCTSIMDFVVRCLSLEFCHEGTKDTQSETTLSGLLSTESDLPEGVVQHLLPDSGQEGSPTGQEEDGDNPVQHRRKESVVVR